MSVAPLPEEDPVRNRPGARRVLRLVLRLLGAVLVAALVAAITSGLWLRLELRRSLPQLEGDVVLLGLTAPVTVERDSLGVPTVRGADRADVARATGFVHAQDRFFQMDLTRRRAAGELAELFGPAALRSDRELRIHRFRTVARRVMEGARPEERALLEAYAAGVNAGLASLKARPFEYLALRADPRPWRPEDTVLVVLAMFVELHDEKGTHESGLGLMHDLLPRELFEFLSPAGTEWDAPIVGPPLATPAVPGPQVLDLRSSKAARLDLLPIPPAPEELLAAGSNNWVVAAGHTAGGRALLANDMHLGLSVPNTWYRASLVWPGTDGTEWRVTGVTLPGAPNMIVGSNRHVAWGLTNTEADWTDLVVLEVDPRDHDAYFTPSGPRRLEIHRETIQVKGRADEVLDVPWTIWGPLVAEDHLGRPRALRWTAHETRAVNFGLIRLETARGLDEVLSLSQATGGPPANIVCADASGRIGWTIMGAIPRRVGFDGRLPTSWADGSRRWEGWLEPEEYPRVVDPPSGRIWTANARVVGGEPLASLGAGANYALGARARQIRDDLLATERATEGDMLRIQLDDRALFFERWRELLLKTLTPAALSGNPRRSELRRYVDDWGGRAAIGSVGYRAVRTFRSMVAERALTPLVAPCRKADPQFDYLAATFQYEGPLWRLVSERPAHLLDPRFASWDDLLLSAADAGLDALSKDGGALARSTWGQRNTVRIQHPLSRAVPSLARWLDVPPEPLPGDTHMPRAQGVTFGASERLVVSPGHEADGYFHMPVGQSGHPLSPHYADGHRAWAKGEPTPFLPGPTLHTLTLKPGEGRP